jgi:hypothetical protein
LEGLLAAGARQIKDLDTVTVVGSDEAAGRIEEFFDRNRDELKLCPQTSDVFVARPLTGESAEKDGPYPAYMILHMLTWARPYVIRMSDRFRHEVLGSTSRGVLSDQHLEELPDGYLIAALSIGFLSGNNLCPLTTEQIKQLVDVATQYKLDYYTGERDDYAVKTGVTLPDRLRWGALYKKLSGFGLKL